MEVIKRYGRFCNRQFEVFISEKDIEENLLVFNAVPLNIRGLKNRMNLLYQ